MRRQRWASLVMIVLLGLLAACGAEPGGGGGQAGGAPNAPADSDGKVHLVYFNAQRQSSYSLISWPDRAARVSGRT